MKKIITLLMVMLMSVSLSASAGTTTDASANALKLDIPVNIIIKQTVTFMDGKTIELFYQKEGDVCRLYSKTDITKYTQEDLNRVKSTNFERVNHVEGKCYVTKKTGDLIGMARSLFR